MIDSLQLNNFQSHENSKLEFTPGINVIIGKSDSGKSSVLKALLYAVKNKPASNNYPSHWIKNSNGKLTEDMRITISKNKNDLVRVRNQFNNGYTFNDVVFNAIGRDVPEEIQNYFNLQDVNIQQQFDSHFLLSETPGAIARFLNELVKLDDIDIYLSAVDSKKRETNRELKNKESIITETEKDLKKYDWLEPAQELAEQYKNVCWELELIHDKFSSLQTLFQEIKNSKNVLKRFENLDIIIKLLATYQIIQSDYTIQSTQIENLKLLKNQILANKNLLTAQPDLQKAESLFEAYSEICERLENKETDISNLQDYIQSIVLYQSEKFIDSEKFEKLVQKIQTYQEKIKSYNTEKLYNIIDSIITIKNSQKNISSIISKLELQLPNICPLCGKNL